jgi:CubicO group peptidase (beta-lactamase class C family)
MINAMNHQPSLPDDGFIQQLLQRYVTDDQHGTCAVASVVDGCRRSVVAVGRLGKEDLRPATGDTLFEIGSITKGFTALLLCDMVSRAEVSLTMPVNDCLPASVVPSLNGREITLEDLATHTSSLPALPDNGGCYDPANPYAEYSVEMLYAFLEGHKLGRAISSTFEYSNLGFGLLGHALAHRLGMPFETALTSRVFAPLSMNHTRLAMQRSGSSDHATGYSPEGTSVPFWDIPTLAGAGAMRSSGNDLLTFLGFAVDNRRASLRTSHEAQFAVRRPKKLPGDEMALGWHVRHQGEYAYAWHNGGTGGFRSYLSFRLDQQVGLAILSNCGSKAGVDAMARSLLERQ